MKKYLVSLAALSLAVPSMASAETAAQALSVKSAAVQPVRAGANAGESRFATPVVGILALVAVVAGLVVAFGGDDSDSD